MFYFKDDNGITVFFKNGETAHWSYDSGMVDQIFKLAKKNNWTAVESINNLTKAILNGDAVVDKDSVMVHGYKAEFKDSKNSLVRFIGLLSEKGMAKGELRLIKPFLQKVFDNEFIDAPTELYDFCKAGDFEITTDGNLLAYKKVRSDLGSVHDKGKTKHTIGEYTEVEDFDTDRTKPCSKGLHFCSHGYLSGYGGDIILVMEIDPRDIVSIPEEHGYLKGRCRKYKPIGIIDSSALLKDIDISSLTYGKVETVSQKQRELREKAMEILFDKVAEVAEEMGMEEEEVEELLNKNEE